MERERRSSVESKRPSSDLLARTWKVVKNPPFVKHGMLVAVWRR